MFIVQVETILQYCTVAQYINIIQVCFDSLPATTSDDSQGLLTYVYGFKYNFVPNTLVVV